MLCFAGAVPCCAVAAQPIVTSIHNILSLSRSVYAQRSHISSHGLVCGLLEVSRSLGDPEPAPGLLPTWTFRVRIDGSKYFVFRLTRQSDYDPKGDVRDNDGFERCWFVWSIQPDDGGNARVEAPGPAAVPAL